MRAYLGADWSSTEAACAVAGATGDARLVPGRAEPTLASVRQFVGRAREMVGADEVYVMIEAGARAWISLFHAAGAVVFVVDPKQARRFAESRSSSGAKDDSRDALSLAEMCRSEPHRKKQWEPDSPELQQVDVLCGLQEQLTTDLGRSKQRLRDIVRAHMPLVERALPKDLTVGWVDRFLRKVPTPWHARKLTRPAFDRLLGRSQAVTRDRVWDALQRTAAPWLDDKDVANAIATGVRVQLDQMAMLDRQLAEVEKQIDAVTAGMERRTRAETMGGVAMKMATALIRHGFRDEVPSDRDAASVQMGASPVFVGSGRRRDGRPKGVVRMRRAVASSARRATYLLGRLVSQRLNWARAMYADAMSRGQKPATAYRRITRSVLRIQTAMARNGEDYDDARYVAALKAKGVPWAAAL